MLSMNNRTKGMALAIITAVMWGIMGVFVRTLSQYQFTNLEISFFRCALAGVAYFLFLIFTNPSALKIATQMGLINISTVATPTGILETATL